MKSFLNIFRIIILTFFAVIFLQYCSTKEVNPESLKNGYDYFPINSGLFREYYVVQIRYTADGSRDSTSWYYKEIQKFSLVNQAGDSLLQIERYKRLDTTGIWQIDSVFQVKKNKQVILATENNKTYIKLVFPVRENKEWDGNAFNTLIEEIYHYSEVSKESVIMGYHFPITVRVIQDSLNDPIVNYVLKDELYASGVGLIYKELINYHYCTDEDCLGKSIISYGIDYKQWILKFGNE